MPSRGISLPTTATRQLISLLASAGTCMAMDLLDLWVHDDGECRVHMYCGVARLGASKRNI
jgi:hypothetical protein